MGETKVVSSSLTLYFRVPLLSVEFKLSPLTTFLTIIYPSDLIGILLRLFSLSLFRLRHCCFLLVISFYPCCSLYLCCSFHDRCGNSVSTSTSSTSPILISLDETSHVPQSISSPSLSKIMWQDSTTRFMCCIRACKFFSNRCVV